MFLFGAGKLIATPTYDASGAAVSNPTPIAIAVLQDISVDIDFETKQLHGEKQFAVAVGRGKGKIGFKAKSGNFDPAAIGHLLFGSAPTAARKGAAVDVAGSVPSSSAYTITPTVPGSGTYVADLGVTDVTTGLPMKRVASSPATGEYSVNTGTGVYTFASADASKAVLISFEYLVASSATSSLSVISNNLMGYMPNFSAILYNSYAGKTFGMKLNQCALSKHSLPFKNDDFLVVDLDVDAYADSAGGIGYICSY